VVLLTGPEDQPGTPRPLWLLDVDGVLNAVTGKPDRSVWPDWRQGSATAAGTAWPIWFSPTVLAALRRHVSAGVEVRWLTTWGHEANASLRALLELPRFEVAGTMPVDPVGAEAGGYGSGDGRSGGTWWKADVVRRVVEAEPDRALLWTDDDLAQEPSARAWVQEHVSRSLLLAPQTHLGLTPKHLRRIAEFLEPDAGLRP
jgi:hypothetical protein